MSILMTLRIALKALDRNKMRTVLTMLGMIIGVGAVITMVALGSGAQAHDRRAGQGRRHQHDHHQRRQLHAGRRPQRPGHVDTRLMPEDATALREVPGVQYVAAGVNSRAQVIAGNQNWSTQHRGHRRRLAADPQLADRSTARSSRRRTSAAPPRSRCSGTVVADTLFGPDVDPTGADHPHPQPAVQGDRRDDAQGPGGDGPGPGRHDLRAVHDGAEEAAGAAAHQQHHRLGRRRRTSAPVADGHQRGAADSATS